MTIGRYTDAGRASTNAEISAMILGHDLDDWLPELSPEAPGSYYEGPWSLTAFATSCRWCGEVAAIDALDEDEPELPKGNAVNFFCREAPSEWAV